VDLGDAAARDALDLAAQLDERIAEVFREPAPEGGLAGAAQSDERDAASSRAHVPNEIGDRAAERRGDLRQYENRGIAGAIFEVREMALGDPRREAHRLAREAAFLAQRPHPLAQGDEERIAARGGRFWLCDPGRSVMHYDA
jgi:hypothetical protein